MNHSQLIKRIAEDHEITKAAARETLDRVFSTISDVLADGEQVRVRDFGIFNVKRTKAKKARNPATGATIEVPSKTVVRYRPARPLAERVRA